MKFYSLSVRNFKEIYRDPISTLLGIAMPLFILLIFSSINKKMPLEQFSPQTLTPGIIIFSFTFIIMFAAMLLAKDKQSSFLTRLFTTPLRPADYIVSYILPFLPLALFQIVVCICAGIFLGSSFQNLSISLIPFFLIALICICTGVILGCLFSINQVSGIGSVLITSIGLFSGVWMDLKMVGGIFEKVGYALPFAHALDVMKELLSGSGFSDIAFNFTILIVYAIILFLLAILSFKHVMKKI